jgi:hypothetical protein
MASQEHILSRGDAMLLFMLPIGILVYFWDRRNIAQNIALFSGFVVKMQHAGDDDAHKMERIDAMFYENGYKIVQKEERTLAAEKKHFNIGIFFMLTGTLYYVGFFGYILYYLLLQKPRRLCVDLAREEPLFKC